jgi:acyl-Coa thioesterase superfamily protein/acyl-CoA thioesterase superfamily protein
MQPCARSGSSHTLDFAAQNPPWSRAMTQTTKNKPFFTISGETFMPTEVANGPWDPQSLHGRVVIGLLGFVIEQRHSGEDFVPARLTVDMFRLPNITTPIEITTKLVRDGLRIRVVEAEFFSGSVGMARASCQLLRKTQNPPGNIWTPLNWDAPKPADIPQSADPWHGKWAMRPITGAMGTLGSKRLWMSEVRELVENVPLTPFVRVAVAADFASPFANAGDQGLGFINSDVTLYLYRLPVAEWVGFEVVNHHAADGVAIGTSTVAALAQRRPMPRQTLP